MVLKMFQVSYNSSRRYGAEENDAFNPTLMDGVAEAHKECKYAEARRVPLRPQGSLKMAMLSMGDVVCM